MTSLAFIIATDSFDFKAELTGNQVLFNFPEITWAPLDADKEISFYLNDAPGFLSVE